MRTLALRLLILLAFGLAPVAHATTYYADFDTGSDANNGTSTSTPWKRLPGMTGETVTPNLTAGDVVCLKGGVTWSDRLLGTAGVSYYGVGGSALAAAACPGWGTGKFIIDVPLATGAFGAFQLTDDAINVTLDGGLLINRATDSASAKAGIYAEGSSGHPVTGFTVRNVQGTLSANGLAFIGFVNDWTITASDFSDNLGNTSQAACNGSGLLFSNHVGSTNVFNGYVGYSTGHRNGPACFNGADNEGRGITFQNEGSTVLVEHSSFVSNGTSTDGAALDGGGYNAVTLQFNEFNGWTAAEIKANADNWIIHGNKFIGRSTGVFQYGYFSAGGDSIGSKIINNLMVSTNINAGPVTLSSPGTGTEFRNNLLVCAPTSVSTAIVMTRVDTAWAMSTWNNNIDHNAIQGCANYSREVAPGPVATDRSLAAHQAAYPLQAQSSRQQSDLSLLADYRTLGASPLRRAGTASPWCVDYRGRVCNNPPDIGAYQSGQGDPATPRNAATRTLRGSSGLNFLLQETNDKFLVEDGSGSLLKE